jgi:hypothetical protein
MSIQTLKELQDQFVAKHGGYFYADPCFPHDNIPRFCADGTDLHYLGSNLTWCAVLNIKGTALQGQCGYVPKPEHPENSSYDETRDFWRWSLTMWYRALVEKATATAGAKAKEPVATVPTLKELQAEFMEINPKRITFVGIPTLRVPYPVNQGNDPVVSEADKEPTLSPNSEDYWQWIGYIEERGQELASQAGVKGSQEPRYAPEHPCWRLWIAVTWYEDLYCTLTGMSKSWTLMERDRDMSAIVLRVGAAKAAEEITHRERAHAEDVETLRDLLDAKDRLLEAKDTEIAKLKAALASLEA